MNGDVSKYDRRVTRSTVDTAEGEKHVCCLAISIWWNGCAISGRDALITLLEYVRQLALDAILCGCVLGETCCILYRCSELCCLKRFCCMDRWLDVVVFVFKMMGC